MSQSSHAANRRPPRFALALHLSLVVATLIACGSTPAGTTGTASRPGGRGVLFVGNSLTYVNDVPGLVQALADSVGVHLDVRTVAFPDFALEDHWASGGAVREIERGDWELVVMQQGPSSTDANRANLRDWSKRFGGVIAARGARPALYSVWPSAARQADFTRAIESYSLAAADVRGDFYPVASAWLAAWRRAPALALYAGDALHASPIGSYLAALVIAAEITGRPTADFPTRVSTATGATLDVGAVVGALLKEAASEALRGAAPALGPA